MTTHTETLLLQAARDAAEQAYAPYSRFAVGAALEAADGRVFTGCNVENASYGLTLCAERAAVATAVAAGVRTFRRLAIVVSGPTSASPCGACRQVLAEFADDGLPILMASVEDITRCRQHTLGELLPNRFNTVSGSQNTQAGTTHP